MNIDKMFSEWLTLNEGQQTKRYSVEVNYRSEKREVLDNFAHIVLGYISAAMKNCGYHCKVIATDKPYRVIISTRNWDEGEWCGVVCYNHKKDCFMIGKGSYNKDRSTVSITEMIHARGDSASEIVRELRNKMETLKKETPVGSKTLKPIKLKRGPKPKKGKAY